MMTKLSSVNNVVREHPQVLKNLMGKGKKL